MMKSTGKWMAATLLAFLLGGCGDNDDRLRERARIESEQSSKADIEADNENRAHRSLAMENDLEFRNRLFSIMAGVFQGEHPKKTSDGKTWKIQFTVTNNYSYFKPDRIRLEDELQAEFDKMSLSVSITKRLEDEGIWKTYTFPKVVPIFREGRMIFDSENSPWSYEIHFLSIEEPDTSSGGLASKVLNGEAVLLNKMRVREIWKTTGESFNYSVERGSVNP